MTRLLLVLASPTGDDAYSTRAGHVLATRLSAGEPDAEVTVRDLGNDPPPYPGPKFVEALQAPAARRTKAQEAQLAAARAYADELEAAEAIIIATPMINFGPPAQLKAWFDHIVSVTAPVWGDPLAPRDLKGRKVYLVETRVPLSGGGPSAVQDFQEPHLRAMLAMLGLTDIETIFIDCLAQEPEAALRAFDASLREISRRFR